jgi:hypothetical protein
MINRFFSADNVGSGYDSSFRDIVDGVVDLTKHRMKINYEAEKGVINPINAHIMSERNAFFSTFNTTEEYNKKNDIIIKNILRYAAKGIDFVDPENMETFKNPMLKSDPSFLNRMYAVISMALPSISAGIVAFNYAAFGETRDISFGDTPKFDVPSVALFTVNRFSDGKRHGPIQRLYGTEMTVETENYGITVAIDWYKMITGRFDLGDWMARVSNSFAHDIGYRAYKCLDDSYSGLPSALKLGGFSEANFTTMAQRIAAANQTGVYVLGTQTALGTALPTEDGLKWGLGQEYVNSGYLGRFLGTGMILLPNGLKKSTVHDAGAFTLLGDDTRLYFMPLGGDRPVKIVMEGNAVQVTTAEDGTADKNIVMTISHRYGVKIAVGGWYGIMDMS